VSVLLPATGPGRNAPRETLEGRVNFIDNAVDASSGTIRVKAEVANPKQQLWPGQYTQVKLQLRTLKDAAVVPQAALVIRGQERFVYAMDAAGQAELRKVQLRYNAGEFVALEGVQPGEKVVLEGKQNLRPGTPLNEAPARAGKPASGAVGAAASAPASGAAR
jgi:RND family efflux transporter MFP subunit